MALAAELEKIYRAVRDLRDAETRFLAYDDEKARVEILVRSIDEALALDDRREAQLRLEQLADLCAQVSGPKLTDALIKVLDEDEPGTRLAAGEALLEIGHSRYAELARGIDRALDANKSGNAMMELPHIIGEIGEPSALPLLRRFFKNENADVVAAAVEAIATLADPSAIPWLEELVNDDRVVRLDDDGMGTELDATVGELAQEAISALSIFDDEEPSGIVGGKGKDKQ